MTLDTGENAHGALAKAGRRGLRDRARDRGVGRWHAFAGGVLLSSFLVVLVAGLVAMTGSQRVDWRYCYEVLAGISSPFGRKQDAALMVLSVAGIAFVQAAISSAAIGTYAYFDRRRREAEAEAREIADASVASSIRLLLAESTPAQRPLLRAAYVNAYGEERVSQAEDEL